MNTIAKLVFLLLTVLFFSTESVVAQTPQATPAAMTPPSYTAPSVSILPGSFLYSPQLIWDKLSLIFTYQPYSKAKKYVALADRELTAASMIIGKGGDQEPIGLHTAFRGENYMTLFVDLMKRVAYEGGSLDRQITQMAHLAYPYHQYIISQMIQQSSGDAKKSLTDILEFSERNEKELTNLEFEYSTTAP